MDIKLDLEKEVYINLMPGIVDDVDDDPSEPERIKVNLLLEGEVIPGEYKIEVKLIALDGTAHVATETFEVTQLW